MTSPVSIIASGETIPSNAITVLRSVSPLLRAMSADNLNPLAVVQMEALGACFNFNGELAMQAPDLLVRYSSMRIGRFTELVGWMRNDTSSALSQTAGGRSAALLCLGIIELFGVYDGGVMIHQLSSRILPYNSNHSSMTQLSQVAERLNWGLLRSEVISLRRLHELD